MYTVYMTSTLSGSRKPSSAVHACAKRYARNIGPGACDTACGQSYVFVLTEGPGMPVTCKRCLASLAKRDREFQRKARKWWTAPRNYRPDGPATNGWRLLTQSPAWPLTEWKMLSSAEEAIAREEGRPVEWGRVTAEWQGKTAARAIAREEGRA